MTMELALVAPLIGLAAMLTHVTRRDPGRRARQEAAWRTLICESGRFDLGSPPQ